jgi:hypothetical protein
MMTSWTAIQGEQAAVVGLPRAMVCVSAAASNFTVANRFVSIGAISVRTAFDSG